MTDDTVTAKLAEWEALVEGATPGEWTPENESDPATPDATEFWWVAAGEIPLGTKADAEFIAAAPDLARALLGFVREVRALHASSQDTRGVGQIRDGAWTAYCEEDLEDWPCPTEQAARKWLSE